MTDQNITTKNGWRHPLGATPDAGGVNFSIFSYDARGVELLLFHKPEDSEPTHVISLDPAVNATFFFWHIYVSGLRPGAHYANAKRGHFGYKRSAKGGVLSEKCLGELVIKGPARMTALAKPCSLLGRDSGFIGSRVEGTEARVNRKYRNSLRSL